MTYTQSSEAESPAFLAGGDFANLTTVSEADSRNKDDDPLDPYAGMSAKERRAAERAARRLKGTFEDYPHLLAMKPREGYLFRSDYYDVDTSVACVLGFFHSEAARDDFGPFWGINRIPSGLGSGVSVIVMEQVRRMGEKWVNDRMAMSETLQSLDNKEQASGGTSKTRRKAEKISTDMEIITAEVQDGASYLHVHDRLLVKAPNVDALDDAVEKIGRLFVDRFGTLSVAPYHGEQRQELTGLFLRNEKKRGRGEHFTSVEFAGAHSLVTNGLNDPSGEYVGSMTGDVNSSAILFDVNAYEHHVVVADSSVLPRMNRAFVSDAWGSKISQSALLNNARVVHLVLDGANLDDLGPKFPRLTARLDMSNGDINMLEMFGRREDELSIFPAHLEKLVLMAEQVYEATDSDRSIIRGSLKEILTQFYIEKGMWERNAGNNRDRLRLVGLNHQHVPRLQDLMIYFDIAYKKLANSSSKDEEEQHAINVLRLVYKDLLDNNDSLFNTFTNPEIDSVGKAGRVIYDFSQLMRRGKGIAMAQLVNTVGFAVDNLGLGDVVIVHGTENISSRVKEYIDTQFEHLFHRGGRVAYLYNSIEKMLADVDFNHFDKADWTVLGPMTENVVAEYQKRLKLDIPPDLERLVTKRDQNLAYLRRGVTNVVFAPDLSLGFLPSRQAQRDRIAAKIRAEEAAKLARAAASTAITSRETEVPERSAVTEEAAPRARVLRRSERKAAPKLPGTQEPPTRERLRGVGVPR